MKVRIDYKTDNSAIPYCAFTTSRGDYECEWSAKSFDAAKEGLVNRLRNPIIPVPEGEEVEI